MTHHVELPGGTLAYESVGEGPPIVFVHGIMVNGSLWRQVVPGLAGAFRCIVPTLPLGGHAHPMAADADVTPRGVAELLARFLEALDLQDVTLVGCDTGGAICQLLIAQHPERIGRLVLANCDAFENFLPPVFRPLQHVVRIPGFTPLVSQTLHWPFTRWFFGQLLCKRVPEQAVLADWLLPLASDAGVQRDFDRFVAAISARDTLAAAETFPRFTKPVLLPWGEDDPFFPPRFATRLRDAFPHARHVPIPDCRTFVSEDQPEVLTRLIQEFMLEPAAAA